MPWGDVTDRLNLTPVALEEATLVAERLFNKSQESINYENIPSAVFSQPALATVGLSQEQLKEKKRPFKVYQSQFCPLKYTLLEAPKRECEKNFVKVLVCPQTDSILGCHMVGEEAPEIIQGLAIAIKSGAKKSHFDQTFGLHPTAAEELQPCEIPSPRLPPLLCDSVSFSLILFHTLCALYNIHMQTQQRKFNINETLTSLGLICLIALTGPLGCRNQVRDKNEQNNQYVEITELAFDDIQTIHQAQDLNRPIEKKYYLIKACLTELGLNQRLKHQEVSMKGTSLKSTRTDSQGCLYWDQQIDYSYTQQKSCLVFQKKITFKGVQAPLNLHYSINTHNNQISNLSKSQGCLPHSSQKIPMP